MSYNIQRCRNPTASCICWSCWIDRLQQYNSSNPNDLLDDLETAQEDELLSLEVTFAEVLKQIAVSKAFKLQIYALYRYRTVAPYLKGMLHYTQDQAKRVATPINRNVLVYDNIQKILKNIANFPLINLKRLSAEQLYQAMDYNWCLMHSNVLRRRLQPSQPLQQPGQQRAYSDADFDNLVQMVKGHQAFRSINQSPANNRGKKEISALLTHLQEAILAGQ